MRRISIALFLAFLFSLFISYANCEVIVIGAEDDWLPYANNEGLGMTYEIVQAAFEAVGIEIQLEVHPYDELIDMALSGDVLCFYNVPYDEAANEAYILGEPLFEAEAYYFHNTGNPLPAGSKEEITKDMNLKIGTVHGYGYGDHYNKITEEGIITDLRVESERINLEALLEKQIDATIIYRRGVNVLLAPGVYHKIEKAFECGLMPIHLAFSKTFNKGKTMDGKSWGQYFSDKLDEGLRIIKENGKHTDILLRYL